MENYLALMQGKSLAFCELWKGSRNYHYW